MRRVHGGSMAVLALAATKAGTAMPAKPVVGATYSQGLAPEIEFGDGAKVVSLSATLSGVPLGPFTNVLVIEESDTFAPEDGQQLKYHMAGIGLVRVTARGEPEGEFLNLVKVNTLSPGALDDVNREAIKLDRRGYVLSDVDRCSRLAER